MIQIGKMVTTEESALLPTNHDGAMTGDNASSSVGSGGDATYHDTVLNLMKACMGTGSKFAIYVLKKACRKLAQHKYYINFLFGRRLSTSSSLCGTERWSYLEFLWIDWNRELEYL